MSALTEHLAAARRAQERRGTRRTLAPAPAPDVVDLAGNDYLDLARHPAVLVAGTAALQEWGAGATGSRVVAGNLAPHERLDAALARLTGAPAAVSLASGYAANLAAVTSLVSPGGCVVLDAHAHASLVDGARLSGVPVHWAEHDDPGDVARLLRRHGAPGSLVLVESVYSALGDAASLPALAEVSSTHDATLVIDEAHGLGVLGPTQRPGAGGAAAAGLTDWEHVVLTGALGKACAAQGGFVAGSAAVVAHVVAAGRTLVYDTAASPAAAAAASAAVELVLAEPTRVARLAVVAARLAAAVGQPAPAGAIVSIPLAGDDVAGALARAAEAGVRVGLFRPGSTPDGTYRLRVTAHAGLSGKRLARAVAFLNTVHPA